MGPKGNLYIISGPSGVGKGTLVKMFLKAHPEIKLSISATTRKPREGEKEGEHYYFIDKELFLKQIEEGKFVEWTEFSGNYYGTYYKTIKDSLELGNSLILEIEVNGAMQVKEKLKDAVLIFILPPSFEELQKRLILRGTETEDAIKTRLEQVQRELKQSEGYDKKLINNDLDIALKELEDYIKEKESQN